MKVHSWRKERKLCWSLTSSRGIIKDDFNDLHCNTGVLFELCLRKVVPFYLYTFKMVCSNQNMRLI